MAQARHKPTTNEFYRSVLDNALREEWKEAEPEEHEEKVACSRRLSSLYGYSMKSAVIKQRVSSRQRQRASQQRAGTRSSSRQSSVTSPSRENTSSALADLSCGLLDSVVAEESELADGGMDHSGAALLDLRGDDDDAIIDNYDEPLSAGTMHPIMGGPQREGALLSTSRDFYEGKTNVSRQRSKKKRPTKSTRLLNAANSMLHPGARAPPWYAGYKNSTQVLSHADREVGQRYGYSAVLNFQRLEHGIVNKSVDRGITNVTLRNAMPKFKGHDAFVDEYKPPLSGQPGTWPPASTYVSGSNLKPPEPMPEITPHLKAYMERVREGVEDLSSSIMAQQREADAHRSTFLAARPSLEIDSRTGKPVHLANELVQAMPRVRFWRGSTVLTERAEDEASLEKLVAKQQQQFIAMVALKWSESMYLYKLLRALSVQLRPGLEEFTALLNEVQYAAGGGRPRYTKSLEASEDNQGLDGLGRSDEEKACGANPERGLLQEDSVADALRESADEEIEEKEHDEPREDALQANSTTIDRETFVNVVCAHFEHADRRRINKLYSGFDPHRMDAVDYRVILATQRCFWKYNNESLSEKLHAIFDIFDGNDRSGLVSAEDIIAMLQVCAASETDEQEMLQAARISLGSVVAEHSLVSEPGYIHREEFTKALAKPAVATPLLDAFGRQLQARIEVLLPSGQAPLSPGPVRERTPAEIDLSGLENKRN